MLNSFFTQIESCLNGLLNTVGVNIQIGYTTVKGFVIENNNAAIDLDGVVVFRQGKTLIVPDVAATQNIKLGDRVYIEGKAYSVVSVDGSPNTAISPLPFRKITVQERLP
jgi:uncharacterized Zn-binding protein involved in type VI secretion